MAGIFAEGTDIIAVPMSASPSLASQHLKEEGEFRHSPHEQHDLPSPPSSVSKPRTVHSSVERDDDKDLLRSESHQSGIHSEDIIKNQPYSPSPIVNAPPPSPPPSTHSSEDILSSISPSYFYPQTSGVTEIEGSPVLSADEAPGIPVFEPTWEEFKDFYTFCQRIDEWGMKTGIVKIIPPKEWIDALPRLDGRQGSTSTSSKQHSSGIRYTDENPLSQVRIKNSIEQIFTPAGSGSWRQSNVVHPGRIINAKQWADLCASTGQKGPEMSRMKDNAKRGAEDGAEEDGVRTRSGRGNRTTAAPASTSTVKRKRSADAEKPMEEEVKTEIDLEVGEMQASTDDMPALEDGETDKQTMAMTSSKTKIADRTTQQEWDDFDYVGGWCDEAGQDVGPQDWSPNVCKAIESEYWRGLNFGKAPMYGADLKGTLFTSATRHWNVGVLDNILTRLRLRRKLPGVTTPYLYFGMWRATFAWHVEDMDLYSINYIHFGAPKQWYAIRQSDRQRFELAMAGAFPGDSSRCRHFMRHKSYLASPAFLASAAGIKPLRLVQKAQEFVITYPYGYHSGFNLGFNCAESVNFALQSWLDIGRKAGYCDCANDSVKMDVDAMLEESKEMEELERKKEEKERRKEAEEKILQSEEEKAEARRAKDRERRRIRKEEQARQEALGILKPTKSQDSIDDADLAAPAAKRAKTQEIVCVFCPSMLEEDLVVIPYPGEDGDNKIKRSVRRAHRLCASFVPETWIGTNPKWQEGSQEPREVVMGFEGIAKARWSLKCQTCFDPALSKKGAKVQCTYGKCFRTSHVSCALLVSSGWMLDILTDNAAADELEGKTKKTSTQKSKGHETTMDSDQTQEVATLPQEADENEEEGDTRIVILCKQHNPLEKEKEARRRAEIVRLCVGMLSVNQSIKVRTNSGLWEATLQEIIWSESGAVEGEVIVDGGQSIKWSKILFDQDVIKKAEGVQEEREEMIRQEEEEAAIKAEEAARAKSELGRDIPEKVTARPTTAEEEERRRIKAEEAEKKAQAKAVEHEAKEAARRVKDEERKAKEVKKLEKMAERASKAALREEKVKAKEQKKAEKEQKAAVKRAKVEAMAARKQAAIGQTGHSEHPAPNHALPEYIRDWQPQVSHFPSAHLPRPHLPAQANEPMDRKLAPLWHTTGSSGKSYPAHLATFQSRIQQPLAPYHLTSMQQHHSQQHPQQQHQHHHQQMYQHPHLQSRPLSSISNLHYASHYFPRQVTAQPIYAYHHQGQYGSQQHAHTSLHSHAYHTSTPDVASQYGMHATIQGQYDQKHHSPSGQPIPLSMDGPPNRPAMPTTYDHHPDSKIQTSPAS